MQKFCSHEPFCAGEAVRLNSFVSSCNASAEEFGPQSPADLVSDDPSRQLFTTFSGEIIEGTQKIADAVRYFHVMMNGVPRPDCATCPLRPDATQ